MVVEYVKVLRITFYHWHLTDSTTRIPSFIIRYHSTGLNFTSSGIFIDDVLFSESTIILSSPYLTIIELLLMV